MRVLGPLKTVRCLSPSRFWRRGNRDPSKSTGRLSLTAITWKEHQAMANSLLTINMITAQAVMIFKNSNAFMQNIDTQYDGSFAQTGAKIGNQLPGL